MLPSEEESLWEYLHRADFELWSARNYPLMPVIVLDQFEELFTLGERVPDLVRAFRNDLGDLAENRMPADLAARIRRDEAVFKAISFAVAELQVIDQPSRRLSSRPRRMAPAYSRAGTFTGAAASLQRRRRIRCGAQTSLESDDGYAGAPVGGHHRRRGPSPRPRHRKDRLSIATMMTLGMRKSSQRCSAFFAASSMRSASGVGDRTSTSNWSRTPSGTSCRTTTRHAWVAYHRASRSSSSLS